MIDFDFAANEIVSNSICTALCIDNALEEPYVYVENPSESCFKLPKELYESFKEKNCVLDFHKYVDFNKWEFNKDRILKNKDLLILDWQLTNGDPPFKDTLEILLESVKTDSLPFIYIYTEKTDLSEVSLHINSYFSGITFDDLKQKYELLCDKLEDLPELEDINEFLGRIRNILREIIFHPDRSNEVRKEIFGVFNDILKSEMEPEQIGKNYDEFLEIGKHVFGCDENDYFLKYLGLFLNNGTFRKEPVLDIRIIPIENEENTFLIHNTLVKIATKNMAYSKETPHDVVSAEQVYSDFSQMICRRPRNFLALLGLELRNLYRDSSSIIGKDINEINELAFFHHQESLEIADDGAFYEFLSNIWKDEVSSFLLNQKPLLFSVLNDYKTKNEIETKLEGFRRNSDNVIQNLAKLNYYYSILRINQDKSRKIRFGDMFSIAYVDIAASPIDNEYLLCITPHCECLRPNKINNGFYFVIGTEITLSNGLKQGDTGFISYIKTEKGIICIEWKTRPFTIYIPDNNIIDPIECVFSGEKITLRYLTCQKENYTQRIANESFSSASKVGIDLAKIE